MVAKHIKSLLYDHDCVIIPEFGGLITRYVSASVHPVKHTFAPPSKKIAFNEKLILNDGLLISTISYHNNVSAVEAQRMVAAFVLDARNSLSTEKKFELNEVGVFRYNAERKLVFEHTEQENMLEDSFGLPEFTARPIRSEEPRVLRTLLKEKEQPVSENQHPFRRKLRKVYRVAAGVAILGLTSSALYLLSLQTDYNLSSLNPISQLQINNPLQSKKAVERYARGYVPFTVDERQHAALTLATNAGLLSEQEQLAEDQEVALVVTDIETVASETEEQDSLGQQIIVEEVQPVVEVAPEPVLLVKEATGRFYIISGGFSKQDNAETSRDAIIKKGFEAKVLVPGRFSKLYRVSVADYATEAEAKEALATLRKSFGETIWVFNN